MRGRLKKIFTSLALSGTLAGTWFGFLRDIEPGKSPATDAMARLGWSAIGTPLYLRGQYALYETMKQAALGDRRKTLWFDEYLKQFVEFQNNDTKEMLQQVNNKVSANILFKHDPWYWPDKWKPGADSVVDGEGDCEDEALLKKEVLAFLGVPEDNMMLMAISSGSHGKYIIDHYVLAVKVAAGDIVILDSGTTLKEEDNGFLLFGITKGEVHTYEEYMKWRATPPAPPAQDPAPPVQSAVPIPRAGI